MTTYRTEWPCCQSVTETEAWIPTRCPFCEPEVDAAVLALAKFGAAVVDWKFIDGLGFDLMHGDDLNDEGGRAGVVDGELCRTLAPGIADAVAKLTGGDA